MEKMNEEDVTILSEADKLLCNLDTEKEEDSIFIIYKHRKTGYSIRFRKTPPLIGVSLDGFNSLTPKEVEAIYLKMKEMGWLNNEI